jgi:hypothetical protein
MMAYERRKWDVTGVADVTDGAKAPMGRVRRPEWVAHVLDDTIDPPRAVLLHLPSGRRIGLSDTATRIWQEIVASGAAGVHLGAIAAVLAPEYGADPTIVQQDVAALLADMVEGEWVEVISDMSDTSGRDERNGGAKE